MALLKLIFLAMIFKTRLRFPPGSSIATMVLIFQDARCSLPTLFYCYFKLLFTMVWDKTDVTAQSR